MVNMPEEGLRGLGGVKKSVILDDLEAVCEKLLDVLFRLSALPSALGTFDMSEPTDQSASFTISQLVRFSTSRTE